MSGYEHENRNVLSPNICVLHVYSEHSNEDYFKSGVQKCKW